MSLSVSASLLSADFLHLGDDIKRSEEAGIASFHLDVMDGHLAPNLSYGPPVIAAIRKATTFPLDTHLMIDNPWLFLDDYIKLKVDSLLIHAEAYSHAPTDTQKIKSVPRITADIDIRRLKTDLEYIRSHGIQAGVTINPGTDIDIIKPILTHCDSVLIMSVNPGFSGQGFITDVLAKTERLRSCYSGIIKMDGGITDKTAPLAIKAGVDVLITASYLYGSADYKQAVRSLLS